MPELSKPAHPDDITYDTPVPDRRAWQRQFALEAELEGRNRGHERRRVAIKGAIAQAFLNPQAMVLMDPEDPKQDVNDLYQRRGRAMTDPKLMNFNCPLCRRTMAYELFVHHAEPCMVKWYKLTDPTLRSFSGAGAEEAAMADEIVYPKKSVSIKGAVASADSKGVPSPGNASIPPTPVREHVAPLQRGPDEPVREVGLDELAPVKED